MKSFAAILFVAFISGCLAIGCTTAPVPAPKGPVLTPKEQAWQDWLNNEHMPKCPICKRAFEGADSAMCEEAFARFQEALKK